MKNNNQGFSIVLAVVVIIVLAISAFISWSVWSRSSESRTRQQNSSASSGSSQTKAGEDLRVTYIGIVEAVDLSAMPADGDGIFVIKADGQQITVHLSSGESACDRTAIAAPDVMVGNKVKISGDRDTSGVVRICRAGTYIKNN